VGSQFRVVVTDLEMLKEIMVKHSGNLPHKGIISVSLLCTYGMYSLSTWS